MSYGNRGYIAAAGFGLAVILFFAGVTYHSSVSSPQQSQESYREQSDIQKRYADAVAANASSPAYAAYPKPNASDCYKAQNHDSADLCAQWRAALAAERAANAAWWSVFWVIVGTGLSGVGLLALLAALNQTERSLKEARDANAIAASGQRPWIYPETIQTKIHLRDGEFYPGQDEITVSVRAELRNAGSLPATNVLCDILLFGDAADPYPESLARLTKQVSECTSQQGFTIPPGHSLPQSGDWCFLPEGHILLERFTIKLGAIVICYRIAGGDKVHSTVQSFLLLGRDSAPLKKGKVMTNAARVSLRAPSIMT